jgi:cation diffusion facilitator CzcD-associated flavoprotein CzcO
VRLRNSEGLAMITTIDTDYLVIGAGAMGMAFVDTLVSETDATVVVVDRYHRPGGHWTTTYPFVRLHQASAA